MWPARVATLLLLSACAVVTTAPDPTKTAPAADQGIAVLSVTGNTAQVSAFDQVTVRKLRDQNAPTSNVVVQHILRNVSPGLARDTALFIGTLPEGDYVLDRMVDVRSNRALNMGAGAQELIGTFRVKAGALVDLGRVIVTPVNSKVIVGRSARVTSNRELVRRFAREHERFYTREVVAGWTAPRGAVDQVEEYALSRPVGADGVVELPGGEVAAGSRLGTVLVRDTQGRWRALRSDGLESLLWVKPPESADAPLIAAGEFNTIVRHDRASGKLVALDPGNLPPGNLLFIDGNDRAGWFVAQQGGNVFSLYRSATLERGDWKLLRKEDVSASFWSGANRAFLWRTTNGFAYALSEGSLWFYDFGTGQFTERRAPNNNRLLSVLPSANNAIGILTSPGGGFGGVFSGMYVSRDLGASWQEVPSPFNVKVVPPALTPKGTLLVQGDAFGSPELQASQDMGKNWFKVTDAVLLSEQLVVLPTQGILAVENGSRFGIASIRRSGDEGATWRTEYSNFDRAAYDAQQKAK